MRESNALAYLRQLCCLGLSQEMVIKEFLRAVQIVLPSGSNTFTGVDERLQPTYYVHEFISPEQGALIFDIMSDFLSPERTRRAGACFLKQGVMSDPAVMDEAFYRSDLYNQVFIPLDQHHALIAPVVYHGKPIGMLGIYRPRQQKPFNGREQDIFKHLLPYLAHAMDVPTTEFNKTEYSDKGRNGMMILNGFGKVLFLSPEADQLLTLACHPTIRPDVQIRKEEFMAKISQLCRNQVAIFRGQCAGPPSGVHVGPHGRFEFRTFWLANQNPDNDGLIGMTIEHQEPIALKIIRSLQHSRLSPTEMEVAQRLAQGLSSEEIGTQLHIKSTTLKDYCRRIYAKLDIHRREELLPKLLAMDEHWRTNESSHNI